MRNSVLTVCAVALVTVVAACGGGTSGPSAAAIAALANPGGDAPLATDRIYFVMTDRYANGDPANDRGGRNGGVAVTGYDPASPGWWHGGDLKGLTGGCTGPKHGLARIKDIGFNVVWVTPAVANQVSQGTSGGYHGYWGVNFMHIDPHLGSDKDFSDLTSCAHSLGMKVFLDVVVNHTGDIIHDPSPYNPKPYRDCQGKIFNPARYVGKKAFPCLSAKTMPDVPVVPRALANVKKPAWLNDVTNYHDRGSIDFSSCDQQCYEQGDLFGLDDLFTEKPAVVNGLVQIYARWIEKYKLDGFRVDTARHVNAGFWRLWDPKMIAAAKSVGVNDFQIFGEVFIADAVEQSMYVRDRGLPSVLDFPFQDAATGYASGASTAAVMLRRLQDDDFYRRPDGADPTPPTFLGNHDMGRAAYEIEQHRYGLSPVALLRRVELGYDLLYLMRGAPVVYYGDEVGMMGTGGDQAARQGMFPTQVSDWQTQPRVGSPPIGTGSSFDITNNPIEGELRQLAALRDANPALATGWSVPRYAKGAVLVVSRIDPATKREYVAAFDNGSAPATVTVQTSTAGSWTTLLGPAGAVTSNATGKLSLTIPAVGVVLLKADGAVFSAPATKPALRVAPDDLSNLVAATATVSGGAPVSVAFAVRRAGSKTWRRLDVDTSPPFRGFLDPARFGKHERVQVVAVSRALDGSTAVSAVVPYTTP
jgi:glycosidase